MSNLEIELITYNDETGPDPAFIEFSNKSRFTEVGIESRTIRHLELDLFTEVIDWEEVRDLQIAFLKSADQLEESIANAISSGRISSRGGDPQLALASISGLISNLQKINPI